MSEKKRPTLFQALLPIIFLIFFLFTNLWIFGTGATEGPNQLALILSASLAGIISWRLGQSWLDIETSIVKSISSALGAMLILLIIGSLSGTWLLSGIVPAMIYYGLKVLNPTIFLVATCIVCVIVSLATGSSWSTVATVGIALLGIGKTLNINENIIAGAILSGAYFGDKMSPLSDTTNLAPAMAGTDLFTHVKYMVYTSVPSLIITLIIFFIWGFTLNTGGAVNTEVVLAAIDHSFNINPLLFIVPALVLFMIVQKVPAIPALLIGSLLGGVFAVIFQPQIIEQISGISDAPVRSSFIAVMKALSTTISVHTENELINNLLTSRGMAGMLNTIWLILSAMVFGGIMESCGLLKRIVEEIIKWAHSTGSLVTSTAVTSIFFNLTAGDQYMAIAVPGRMFSNIYRKRGYKPELLSRTLEDAGTVTSVLVPWNTCGATQSRVLGVSTWAYAPYCFFCIISPLMSILQAYLNYKIRRLNDEVKS